MDQTVESTASVRLLVSMVFDRHRDEWTVFDRPQVSTGELPVFDLPLVLMVESQVFDPRRESKVESQDAVQRLVLKDESRVSVPPRDDSVLRVSVKADSSTVCDSRRGEHHHLRRHLGVGRGPHE